MKTSAIKSFWFVYMCLGATLRVNAAPTLPPSWSWIKCYANQPPNSEFGPLPLGLDGHLYGAGSHGANGHVFFYQAMASASTSLEGAHGGAHATAYASDDGYSTVATAGSVMAMAEGQVGFYFFQERIKPTPWNPPHFPFYFKARGEGFATALRTVPGGSEGASFRVSAELFVPGFPSDRFGAAGVSTGGTVRRAFDSNVSLWLEPNDASNPFYEGELYAYCRVTPRPKIEWIPQPPTPDELYPPPLLGERDPDTCEAGAAVDPVLVFDQEAFDERYGVDSFNLSEYYSLRFSDNFIRLPAEALLSCSNSVASDLNSRGFYIPQYPGATLESARLQLSASAVGSYVVTLTVHSNAYDGAILGVATNTITFTNLTTAQNQFATFTFLPLPMVKNGRVCFVLSVLSGPQSSIQYSVPAFAGGCPEVVQTEGTIPPLDTFRRNGVNLQLTGRRNKQQTLVSCSGVPDSDSYLCGFYLPQYRGDTLDLAMLKMSASVAGTYEIAMTVVSNTYGGPILAIKTNTVVFSGLPTEGLPVAWAFPFVPIQKYSRVCFKLSLLSGPSSAVSYAVPGFAGGCTEVIQTEGTAPPLDRFRRNGVDLVIVGQNDPATDLHLSMVRQPAGLFLQWNSFSGCTFTVETNANLQAFAPLQSGIVATAPTNTFGPLPLASEDHQFYRVLQHPAPTP